MCKKSAKPSHHFAIIKIILLHFVLPAVITLFFSEVFRKANLIKSGDMALNL